MKNRDLQKRPTYEYRCDERLKDEDEGSTRLVYTFLPKVMYDLWISVVVYYEGIKRDLNRKHIKVSV